MLVSKWNGSGGGTSQGFNSFRNNSNDANSNPSSGGSFGSRGGGWKRGFGGDYLQLMSIILREYFLHSPRRTK